jgi:CheY-like chemotaxis protein
VVSYGEPPTWGRVTRQRTVLLVDDDAGTLRVLADGLASQLEGFVVLTAGNGREAVEALGRAHVDALVTDLSMPVMDGFALLAYVANQRWALPVTVLSGMSAGDSAERLAGFDGLTLLRKPATVEAVADAVVRSLERSALGQVHGIPLAGVLQLVEAERKSCTLLVKSGRRTGRLYFSSGRLVNAFSDDFGADGEAAAYDILGWEDVSLEFARLPDDVPSVIGISLQRLLIDVADAGPGWRPTASGEAPGDAPRSTPEDRGPVDRVPETHAPGGEAPQRGAPLSGRATEERPAAPNRDRDLAGELLEAVARLAQRAQEADLALAAVAEEAAAFRAAHGLFAEAEAQRGQRRRELEAFRDEAERLAREILARVDAVLDHDHDDRTDSHEPVAGPRVGS